jgi:hypothetical protein
MFVPKINITNINTAADKWTVEDITGVFPADPTGYQQASYLPQNNTVWTKEVFAQYLGAAIANVPFNPVTDKLLPSAELNYQLQDGVYIITEYFSVPIIGLQYSVDATKKILTKTGGDPWVDPLGIFAGVFAVKEGAYTTISSCSVISSVSATTLTLLTAISTLATNDNLTIVYKATKYVLITSSGSNKLIQEIGDLAITELEQGCDSKKADLLSKKIMIQAAAKIHFKCGNYSKAHNAAVLLDKTTQTSSNCDC